MSPFPQVLQFLVVAVAGWINQQPRDVIDSLQEENRVLREQRGPGRLRFTDAQRRRRAAKAKRLGNRMGERTVAFRSAALNARKAIPRCARI